MANNWAGIFELKGNHYPSNTEQPQPGVKLGIGEKIDNGRRTYGSGRADIPMDAPARPSEQYAWDAGSLRWVIL